VTPSTLSNQNYSQVLSTFLNTLIGTFISLGAQRNLVVAMNPYSMGEEVLQYITFDTANRTLNAQNTILRNRNYFTSFEGNTNDLGIEFQSPDPTLSYHSFMTGMYLAKQEKFDLDVMQNYTLSAFDTVLTVTPPLPTFNTFNDFSPYFTTPSMFPSLGVPLSSPVIMSNNFYRRNIERTGSIGMCPITFEFEVDYTTLAGLNANTGLIEAEFVLAVSNPAPQNCVQMAAQLFYQVIATSSFNSANAPIMTKKTVPAGWLIAVIVVGAALLVGGIIGAYIYGKRKGEQTYIDMDGENPPKRILD